MTEVNVTNFDLGGYRPLEGEAFPLVDIALVVEAARKRYEVLQDVPVAEEVEDDFSRMLRERSQASEGAF